MYYDQRHAKYLSNLAKGKKKLNPCIFAPISKERKDFCTAPYFTVFFSWLANLILIKITLFLESSWLKVRLAPLAAPVSLNPLAKGLWSIFSCATCQRAKKYGKIEPYFCTLKNLIISKSPLFFSAAYPILLKNWKVTFLEDSWLQAPLAPLAKGLLSIFSFVTYQTKKKTCIVALKKS